MATGEHKIFTPDRIQMCLLTLAMMGVFGTLAAFFYARPTEAVVDRKISESVALIKETANERKLALAALEIRVLSTEKQIVFVVTRLQAIESSLQRIEESIKILSQRLTQQKE